jgi:hypothetical protein
LPASQAPNPITERSGPLRPKRCVRTAGRYQAGGGVNVLTRAPGGYGDRGEPERSRTMPQRAWSAKRERQYEHIKKGLKQQGRSNDVAEEIAARTVNKERARAGEAREASRTSIRDISSSRRGGLRSHSGPGGRTRDQLYEEAREKGIRGRSKMTKAELRRAVGR